MTLASEPGPGFLGLSYQTPQPGAEWLPWGVKSSRLPGGRGGGGGSKAGFSPLSWIGASKPPVTPVCFSLVACVTSVHVRLFATLWTVACQAPLSMGFSRPEYWNELSCPPPGELLNPGIEPVSPALQVDSLSTEPPGKPFPSLPPLISPRAYPYLIRK